MFIHCIKILNQFRCNTYLIMVALWHQKEANVHTSICDYHLMPPLHWSPVLCCLQWRTTAQSTAELWSFFHMSIFNNYLINIIKIDILKHYVKNTCVFQILNNTVLTLNTIQSLCTTDVETLQKCSIISQGQITAYDSLLEQQL